MVDWYGPGVLEYGPHLVGMTRPDTDRLRRLIDSLEAACPLEELLVAGSETTWRSDDPLLRDCNRLTATFTQTRITIYANSEPGPGEMLKTFGVGLEFDGRGTGVVFISVGRFPPSLQDSIDPHAWMVEFQPRLKRVVVSWEIIRDLQRYELRVRRDLDGAGPWTAVRCVICAAREIYYVPTGKTLIVNAREGGEDRLPEPHWVDDNHVFFLEEVVITEAVLTGEHERPHEGFVALTRGLPIGEELIVLGKRAESRVEAARE